MTKTWPCRFVNNDLVPFSKQFRLALPLDIIITFITSRLYLRTFCDIRLDTEHTKVTEGHQMNLVLTVSMHNYS